MSPQAFFCVEAYLFSYASGGQVGAPGNPMANAGRVSVYDHFQCIRVEGEI